MHKLERSRVPAPPCLEQYAHQTQAWKDLESRDKNKIRENLEILQRHPEPGWSEVTCAYCESPLYHGGHIEHFRQRADFPELTFSWDNLFLSCDERSHCGHFKDRNQHYNPDDLIKPDQDDPDHFLFFHSSGEVRPREGLSDQDLKRAIETIRVFGLNEPSLRGKRAETMKFYKKEYFDEISSWDEELRYAYLQSEIENTQWQPFATTIKHFLQRQN